MKSIRIIKQKQTEPLKEAAAERTKPDEPSPRKIANTIKGWIAESEERRRNHPRSLSAPGAVILIAFAVAMAQSPRASFELLQWSNGRVQQDQLRSRAVISPFR